MKTASTLLFLLFIVFASAQTAEPQYSLLFRDGSVVIKENVSGKFCRLVSCEVTFKVQSEMHKATDMKAIQKLMDRLNPKDKIFLDKVVPATGCMTLPSHIVIEI